MVIHPPELLSVEPNILVVSWGQICDNSLAIIVWGHIFSKENDIGSVWIQLKTENWKHYSKIIFKCVNSTVGPFFNEKIAEKWNLLILWTVHEPTGVLKSQILWLLFTLFYCSYALVHCSWDMNSALGTSL